MCWATRSATLADAPLGTGRRAIAGRSSRATCFGRCAARTTRAKQFVGEAFRRGAAGAVVAKDVAVPDDHWAVRVDDTQQALWAWARWKRRQFTGTVIAVTGSAGKTTTRQMIHTVLQSRLRGTASPRNFNNHYRRALEHDGHRAGPRLRRAGAGREPAGRDRRAGRIGGAAGSA